MANYNTEKTKNKRFNAIDLVLAVLVLIIVTVMIVSSVYHSANTTNQTTDIYYYVRVENIKQQIGQSFVVGSDVYSTENQNKIGEISDFSIEPYIHYGRDTNGDLVETEVDGMINVTLKIKATLRANSKNYTVNGYLLAVGKQIGFRTDKVMTEGCCIAIDDIAGSSNEE